MTGFDDYAKQYGINPDNVPSVKTVVNEGGFYEHKLGDYQVILLDLQEKWQIEGEGGKKKDVAKGTQGAKVFAMHRMFILKDPDGDLVDENFQLKPDVSYGRAVFQQYVSYDPTRQFGNKAVYSGLFINNSPELSVIQGTGNDYTVHLGNLAFYLGAPATMELTKKTSKGEAKNAFIKEGSLTLIKNELDPEIYKKRQALAQMLIKQLEDLKEKEAKERKAKGTDTADYSPPAESSEDDILSKYKMS
jgi:hypothetical protein